MQDEYIDIEELTWLRSIKDELTVQSDNIYFTRYK